MRIIAPAASYLILVGVMVPSILFYAGKMDLDQVKLWMMMMTVAWFVVTPLWMGRETKAS